MLSDLRDTRHGYTLKDGEIAGVLWTGQLIVVHPDRAPQVYNPKTKAFTVIQLEHYGQNYLWPQARRGYH